MVVCSHPTPGWLFAVISSVVFAPEGMELHVRASGLTLLHTPVLWMPRRPWGAVGVSLGCREYREAFSQGEQAGGVGQGEGLMAHPQPGPRGLPGEEVASLVAGAVGEPSSVLLLFSWLHRVSPRRPRWEPCTPQLTQELGAALEAELWC